MQKDIVKIHIDGNDSEPNRAYVEKLKVLYF